MEATEKKQTNKPGTTEKKPRRPRRKSTYYLVEHVGDGKAGHLTTLRPLASVREFSGVVEELMNPGLYSVIRVLKTTELKQGLLAIKTTFDGAEK